MNNEKLELIRKANDAFKGSLSACAICPRRCRIDRTKGKTGYCRAGLDPVVYSFAPHHGEEPPLSGTRGSGNIFFSHCNMKCVYCQNYFFSQLDKGETVTIDRLAKIMLELQACGCHNINLVSPTHYVPQILSALELAAGSGLDIPVVYNTSGYELADTIKALEGIVDIYLPDIRYADDEMAKKYSDAPLYVEHNRDALREMRRQVGDLTVDSSEIAVRGLIIRLLVLPHEISGTKLSLAFIKSALGGGTYLSIMSQYYPTFKAYTHKEISGGITPAELKNVVDEARLLGLNNGWTQETPEEFDPKFYGTNIPPK